MKPDKYFIATTIAILVHGAALAGLFGQDREPVKGFLPYLMPLMLLLIIFTQPRINTGFIIFFFASCCIGMAAEIAGVTDGSLFGEYHYGTVPGPAIQKVPLLAGINWFVIIYCCGVTVNTVLEKLMARLSELTGKDSPSIKRISLITDAAMLAVFFDWIMEPALVKLGYKVWAGSGEAPLYNYACWLVISAGLMAIFSFLRFEKRNRFAVHLLLVMMMYFLLVRTFL